MTTIPTIDLRLLARDCGQQEAHLDELRRTVGTIGAFYLVGHDIVPEEADRILDLTRRFFALPEAERRSIEMANSPHFRGYAALGNESLVLQDDRGGSGLQLFDGESYFDVKPQRGAFVIDLGEALELATNHRLRATLHRVQSPPANRDFFSVPFFFVLLQPALRLRHQAARSSGAHSCAADGRSAGRPSRPDLRRIRQQCT